MKNDFEKLIIDINNNNLKHLTLFDWSISRLDIDILTKALSQNISLLNLCIKNCFSICKLIRILDSIILHPNIKSINFKDSFSKEDVLEIISPKIINNKSITLSWEEFTPKDNKYLLYNSPPLLYKKSQPVLNFQLTQSQLDIINLKNIQHNKAKMQDNSYDYNGFFIEPNTLKTNYMSIHSDKRLHANFDKYMPKEYLKKSTGEVIKMEVRNIILNYNKDNSPYAQVDSQEIRDKELCIDKLPSKKLLDLDQMSTQSQKFNSNNLEFLDNISTNTQAPPNKIILDLEGSEEEYSVNITNLDNFDNFVPDLGKYPNFF